MANTSQARKRARQAKKRDLQNTNLRSTMRTAVKQVLKTVQEKNKEKAPIVLKTAIVKLDRMANVGIIHANKAARLKSRLNKKVKNLVVG